MVTIYSNTSAENDNSFGQCRGTILASRYIITAAHCVTRKDGTALDPDQVVVVPGYYDHRKLVSVSNVTVHEGYKKSERIEKQNDIAILELATRLDLNTYTPACIFEKVDQWLLDEDQTEVLALREEEATPLHSFHVAPLHYFQCVMRRFITVDEFHPDFTPSVICSQKLSFQFLRKVHI